MSPADIAMHYHSLSADDFLRGRWDRSTVNNTSFFTGEPRNLETVVVDGDVDLRGTKIRELPNRLWIHGNFILSQSFVEEMPSFLRVERNFVLSNSRVRLLIGCLLQVGEDIFLGDSLVEDLPQGLTVDGTVHLAGSKVRRMRPGLRIGHLALRESWLSAISDNAYIAGVLDLEGSRISHIGENVLVGSDLRALNRRLSSLPSSLKVRGDLILNSHCPAFVPANMYVGRRILYE